MMRVNAIRIWLVFVMFVGPCGLLSSDALAGDLSPALTQPAQQGLASACDDRVVQPASYLNASTGAIFLVRRRALGEALSAQSYQPGRRANTRTAVWHFANCRYDPASTHTTALRFVATKPGTLLRGDGRAAAEIFEDGMTARNPAMSIEEHLAGGGTV